MIIAQNHSETSQPVSEALVMTPSNITCLPPHIRRGRLQEV